MAKTGAFTYTNKTQSLTKNLTLYDMGERENYRSNGGSGTRTYVNTRAASNDAPEQFTISFANKKRIGTSIAVQYPSPKRVAAADENSSVYEAVKFGIKKEAIHRTTDTTDPTYTVDRPSICEIYFTEELIDTMTVDQLLEELGRTASLFFGVDGDTRLADFIAGIIEIQED